MQSSQTCDISCASPSSHAPKSGHDQGRLPELSRSQAACACLPVPPTIWAKPLAFDVNSARASEGYSVQGEALRPSQGHQRPLFPGGSQESYWWMLGGNGSPKDGLPNSRILGAEDCITNPFQGILDEFWMIVPPCFWGLGLILGG